MTTENKRKAAKYKNLWWWWWWGVGVDDQIENKSVGTSARPSPRVNLTTTNGVDQYLPADQCPNRLPNQLCMLPKRKARRGRVRGCIGEGGHQAVLSSIVGLLLGMGCAA